MKRFLHALAALWPKVKDAGRPPATPTSTGLRQHLAAVLRMERALCGFADLPIRGFAEETVGASALSTVRDQLPESPDTRLVDSPDTRLPESSTQQLTESPDTRLIESPAQQLNESPDTRLIESPDTRHADSPNQPQSLPRIPQPMPLLTILMLVFFMCLMAAKQVSAQAEPAEAAWMDAPELYVGDTVPDEWWDMPLTLWTADGDRTETMSLGDHRGKVIILDFWATWCGNCIYGMRDLFELQGKYGDDIFTLPVTYEKTDYVSRFVGASSYDRLVQVRPVFLTVTENKALLEYFPKNTSLPLIVVISQYGVVDAIIDSRMLTDEYIGALVADAERYAPLKRSRIEDVPPLLEFGLDDVRQYRPVFYNSLTGEIDGAECIREIVRDTLTGTVRILLANHTVLELYAEGSYGKTQRDFAFAGPGKHNRRILEVADPTIYDHYIEDATSQQTVFNNDWNRRFRYSYESILPDHPGRDFRSQLVDDLNNFLGLKGTIANRKVPVYVLSRQGDIPAVKASSNARMEIVFNGWKRSRVEPDAYLGPNDHGYICYVRNMPMSLIATQITLMFDRIVNDFSTPMPIVIDETGIDANQLIDLGFAQRLSLTRQELIENLNQQGFDLSLEEREIPMFVLSEEGYEALPGEDLVLTRHGYVPRSNIQ